MRNTQEDDKFETYFSRIHKNAFLEITEKILEESSLENLPDIIPNLEKSHPDVEVESTLNYILEGPKKENKNFFLDIFQELSENHGLEEYLNMSSIIHQKKKLYLDYEEMKKKLPRNEEKRIKFLKKMADSIKDLQDCNKFFEKF